jgi:hypothetical protein
MYTVHITEQEKIELKKRAMGLFIVSVALFYFMSLEMRR